MARKSEIEGDRGCLYKDSASVKRCSKCCGEGRFFKYFVQLTYNDGIRVDFEWFCNECWINEKS